MYISENFRLADGISYGSGRAEYLKNDKWGTVCDTSFDAAAWPCNFCRQLRFSEAQKAEFVRNTNMVPVGTDYPFSYVDFSCACETPWNECITGDGSCTHANNDVYIWCK